MDFTYCINRFSPGQTAQPHQTGCSAHVLQAVCMPDGPPLLLPWSHHGIQSAQCAVPLPTSGGPNLLPISQPQIETHHIPNLALQNIINVLLDNQIPPSWVDHSYLFGVIYLNTHYSGNGPHQALYDGSGGEMCVMAMRTGHDQLHNWSKLAITNRNWLASVRLF